MRAVIVLITIFVQVISVAQCDGTEPQFMVVPAQHFFFPTNFPNPGPHILAPPGQPPLPPPLSQLPLPPQPPLLPPPPPQPPLPPSNPDPPKPVPCPCSKPPTGAMALLLDIVASLMNLPKRSLSKLPLCSAKDVTLPPNLLALTAPLSSVCPSAQAPAKQLTPAEIVALISLLKTPQALAQTLKCGPNLPLPNCLQPLPQIPEATPLPFHLPPPHCVTHDLERNFCPAVHEYDKTVPVYQNTIHHEEEQTTRNVPVFEKTLTNQEVHIVRQVPVCKRITRPVVETRTRHIPIIRKRIRTVVEPYTSHVPILEKFTRPVEEIYITSVPVVEKRSRPIFMQTVRQVPVTEKRMRPVVRSQITQVPVKQKVVKHFIEHIVKPYVGPCEHCFNPCPHQPCFPFPPTFLNVPGTPSFPCRR